ncbi:uncharacterized protein LOC113383623 [Ctenocephalides felis]|uniref:uncharacterized protein LOC113383623 n=1 Tax=Ctenocephalides felis TaxID=7515 RepID=UPI000E6E5713|nr:uncharacterized protein LOC113383623 [Ctenocephalides felis]
MDVNPLVSGIDKDKSNLEATISKLQTSLSQLRDAESDSVLKSKRNQGLLEQMIFEKSQSDAEVRRLKDELEKQYERVREANHETARRVAEERAAADKRYCAQVDQLGGDLSNQWETANKLQLELERQRRIESDYKREITSRNHQIDDLKTELRNKTASLQSDLAQCNAEKQSLEEEIASLRLSLERADRNSKSEMSRLNSEITSLRQRLDRSDADLLQARRENLRLSEQLANLQKEVTLGSLTASDENPKKDLSLMIHDMENKHMSTVQELESLVQNQSKVMDKTNRRMQNTYAKIGRVLE